MLKSQNRINLKKVYQHGVMLLFGVSFIEVISFLLIGISHQHFLSYKPDFTTFPPELPLRRMPFAKASRYRMLLYPELHLLWNQTAGFRKDCIIL